MGEYLFRSLATIFIWIVVGGIAISAIIMSNFGLGPGETLVTLFSLMLGAAATRSIWRGAAGGLTGSAGLEKAKRGGESSRLALLMEMMDEDERLAFKDTLKQRLLDDAVYGSSDGETLSLEALMQEDKRRHRNYQD